MKFDKNIKFGGQGCPPYGASIGYSYDKLNQDIKNTINWFKSHD